ncbi:hypothetical protein FS837_003411 [Tulasnella sp. UAMH 9824]|nr:hypothetical protein FS837_003411 [Tulasnella sp. UAMH 9824]
MKPLTEEEKNQRLAELRQRAVKEKAVQAVEEAEEAKANEKIRRKAGQVRSQAVLFITATLRSIVTGQVREKIDDAKAKAAIKAQIEADKRERAEKAARDKALRRKGIRSRAIVDHYTGLFFPTFNFGSSHQRKRIQGYQNAALRAVAEFVAGQSLAYNVDTVSFTMQFPRKTFTQADMNKSLKDLGLTPSAVLIAS